MKLREFHVKDFWSVWDSNPISVDNRITCFVGKNESGKTALLKALYRSNPINPQDRSFDTTYDYPKREVEDYLQALQDGTQEAVVVVSSLYELEADDQQAIAEVLGPTAMKSREVRLFTYYDDRNFEFGIETDGDAARRYLASRPELPPALGEELQAVEDWEAFLETLRNADQYQEVESLAQVVETIVERGFDEYVFGHLIEPRVPKFLYFDEYYMMRGSENLNALVDRERSDSLRDSDRPLIGLINLARLEREELLNIDNTTRLKNKLEGTANRLTRQIMGYWSQNRQLSMRFDVRDAKPGDPEGMREGINIWGEVYDRARMATTSLDSRSRGFLWFFSFLAWYQDVKSENMILLLDEPGTSLHGLAKRDLLKYFETELTNHQLVYTTHSPSMVDARKIERVRIVQDLGIDSSDELPKCKDGTKVVPNILDANPASLFPVFRELGYGITQTLLVGTDVLIVEGKSDINYLEAMTELLEAENKEGLSSGWTKLAAGGIDRVPLFVAFLAAQEDLNVAALVDYQKRHQQLIESLYKNRHLKKKNVLTFAQFTRKKEADVEDMFDREFFLGLLNSEFGDEIEAVSAGNLASSPRIVKDVEERIGKFNHHRPARYLAENLEALSCQLSDETKVRFEKLFKKVNALLGRHAQ